MTLKEPAEFDKLSEIIRQGPATLILIYSPTCPHCHTYMPIWNQLKKTSNRQANMVTMEASVYDETPLSEEKQIQSVPSVLYVNKSGDISEVSDIRNETNMKNIIKTGKPESIANATASGEELSDILESLQVKSPSLSTASESPTSTSAIPGQKSEPNPLPAYPAMSASSQTGGRRHRSRKHIHLQRGGNPWAAFLASAGPAALLAGAYAALPMRSSGLPAPRHSAKWRRIRARLTRRRRSNRR